MFTPFCSYFLFCMYTWMTSNCAICLHNSVHICADVHLGSTKIAKYELYHHIIFVWSHCFWNTIRSIVNLGCISVNLMAVMVWFHDISVHFKLALFFVSMFTEPAHSLFDFTFQYTTFFERTCVACLISILNGSVSWFHGIGIHVNLALLLSALRWAHRIGLRIKSEKIAPIRGGWIVFISRGTVFWLLAFWLVQYFDFNELACTSSPLFCFWYYGEHRTGLPIQSEKIPPIGGGWIVFIFRGLLAFGAKKPVNRTAKWFCCCTSDCEYFNDLTGTDGKDRSKWYFETNFSFKSVLRKMEW